MRNFIDKYQFWLCYILGLILTILLSDELITDNPVLFFASLIVVPFPIAFIIWISFIIIYLVLDISFTLFRDAIAQRNLKMFIKTLIGLLLFLLWLLFGGVGEDEVPIKMFWHH